jgi:tetratricopeptide (TPR) repeat protein
MESVGSLLIEGRQLRSLGAYDNAVSVLRRALRDCPKDLHIAFELCETLLIQGYYHEALEEAANALQIEEPTGTEMLGPLRLLRNVTHAITMATVKTDIEEAQVYYHSIVNDSALDHHVKVRTLSKFRIPLYLMLFGLSSGGSGMLFLEDGEAGI